jgi:hypothetical protein
MPWLLQQGRVGWQTADALPDKANAVCAALAVVRLALLRDKAIKATGGLDEDCRQHLRVCMAVLSAAVTTALQALQAFNTVEQAAGVEQGPAGDGRLRVPGEALGAGQAVDAWLAVSRVQDVLDRVLELL